MAALGSGVIDSGGRRRGDGIVGGADHRHRRAGADRQDARRRVPVRLLASSPGVLLPRRSNPGGGSLLRWYKDTFGADDVRRARRRHADPFDVILKGLPEEPTGMIALPHFQGSYSPWMDPSATGAIVGLRLATTREDFVKAILEGTAFELRANIERLEQAGI